jgi:ATP-dependent DNA helicase HFM1/MER3
VERGARVLRQWVEEKYLRVFPASLNAIQQQCFNAAFNDTCNLVVSAPTSCGKTTVFELALVSMLQRSARAGQRAPTAVYIAPIKALCQERLHDWKSKFPALNMRELTSDGDDDGGGGGPSLRSADLVFATPEKMDSVTRKWRDSKPALREIGLLMIDEVHLLHETRGATLEACVSRMRTLSSLPEFAGAPLAQLRIMALSATIPNIADVAQWLRAPPHGVLVFGSEYRPVQVDVKVFAYDDGKNDFLFDRNLNYKLADMVRQYARERPTLVFCTTRNMTEQAAQQLLKDMEHAAAPRSLVRTPAQAARLAAAAAQVSDKALKALLVAGIGFHNASLSGADRRVVEQCFAARDVLVLCTTRTLAQGVNLPAHLVIIKSTMCYNDASGGYVQYSPLDVLQMLGRAGRPQFDREATCVIMCKASDKHLYAQLTSGNGIIESTLLKALAEHLNAEVSSGTIAALPDALVWLKTTYLWVRVAKNPLHYGVASGLLANKLEQLLQSLCLATLTALAEHGAVTIDADTYAIAPTDVGHLMSKFYLAFDTMKHFTALAATAGVEQVIDTLVCAAELRDIALRRSDKKDLNALNKDLRFPRAGKIGEREEKLHCIVQATLGGLKFEQWALNNEAKTVFGHLTRIVRCMAETVAINGHYRALAATLQLVASIKQKMWFDSPHVTRQLPHIGDVMSTALASAGATSLRALAALDPRRIEAIVGRRMPFGDEVLRSLAAVPQYHVVVEQRANAATPTEVALTISVSRLNYGASGEGGANGARAARYADVALVLADTNANRVLLYKKFLSARGSLQFSATVAYPQSFLVARICLLEWVGQDVEQEIVVRYANRILPQRAPTIAPPPPTAAAAAKSGAAASKKRQGESKLCKHTCADKRACAHKCCKAGLDGGAPVVKQAKTSAASTASTTTATPATSAPPSWLDGGGISDELFMTLDAAPPPKLDSLSLLRGKSAQIVASTPARRVVPSSTGIAPLAAHLHQQNNAQRVQIVRSYRPPMTAIKDASIAASSATTAATTSSAPSTVENNMPQTIAAQDVFDDIFGGLF